MLGAWVRFLVRETRSHMRQLKILCATTKMRRSQINIKNKQTSLSDSKEDQRLTSNHSHHTHVPELGVISFNPHQDAFTVLAAGWAGRSAPSDRLPASSRVVTRAWHARLFVLAWVSLVVQTV